jgi:phage baseplate assembly protein V
MTQALLTAGREQRNHRYEGAIRIGVVMERRTGKTGPQLRVQYVDRGVGSAWTAVSQRNTIGTQDYNLPRAGERVIVAHLANGPERGVVLGCLFNEAVSTEPQGNPDNREIKFDDGTVVQYDPGAKSMRIDAAGTISITANTSLSVKAPSVLIEANVEIEGNVEIKGNLKVNGRIDATDEIHTDAMLHEAGRGYAHN